MCAEYCAQEVEFGLENSPPPAPLESHRCGGQVCTTLTQVWSSSPQLHSSATLGQLQATIRGSLGNIFMQLLDQI